MKQYMLFTALILALVVLASLASAALLIEQSTYIVEPTRGQAFHAYYQLKNTADVQTTAIITPIDVPNQVDWQNNPVEVIFGPQESKQVIIAGTLLPQRASKIETLLVVRLSPSDESMGPFLPVSIVIPVGSGTANPTPSVQPSTSVSAPVFTGINGSRSSFCSAGAKTSNLSITEVKIKSSGEDDEEWKLLDEVTVEVEVENTADEEVEDVVVQLGLFDSSGRNMVGKLDFSNEDEEKIELDDIDEDEEETVTFRFRVAGDLDDGNYKLAVKAYSKKSGESNLCTDTSSDLDNDVYQTISVEREDNEGRFIAFDDIRLSPMDATCGDVVTLSANAFNIGEDDQDRVKLTLKSADLKVDATQELRSGLDVGDDEQFTFNFAVPQGLTDKTYTLDLNAEYDYRNGNYREMLDAPHRVPIKIIGCTARRGSNTPDPVMTLNNKSVSPEQINDEKSSDSKSTGFSLETMPIILIAAILILIILIALVAVMRSNRANSRASPADQRKIKRMIK